MLIIKHGKTGRVWLVTPVGVTELSGAVDLARDLRGDVPVLTIWQHTPRIEALVEMTDDRAKATSRLAG